jgi:P-type E1-E2 ATPase
VVAKALTAAAAERGLQLSPPDGVHETPGVGVLGWVEGREVAVGSPAFVHERSRDGSMPASPPDGPPGHITVAVAVDGMAAGLILLRDTIRADVPAALRRFRELGVRRIVLASGDRADVTAAVASRLDIDTVLAEMSPERKVLAVAGLGDEGPTMMVGDGVNDAPALAAAGIGVAMGAHRTVASVQAADAVLLVDRLDRLAEALAIAQKARRIALESVVAGLGLSLAAMIVAAFGYLPPVEGAILQEAIDVAVILNALRALRA